MINPRSGHGPVFQFGSFEIFTLIYGLLGLPGVVMWILCVCFPLDVFKIDIPDAFITITYWLFATIGIYINYKIVYSIYKYFWGS